MLKALKVLGSILGIIAMIASFVVILGTAGASDLNLLPFDQIVIRCLIALVVGAVGFVVVWLIDNIDEPQPQPESEPVVSKPTPEQLFTKCCDCPLYSICTKTLEEVIKC